MLVKLLYTSLNRARVVTANVLLSLHYATQTSTPAILTPVKTQPHSYSKTSDLIQVYLIKWWYPGTVQVPRFTTQVDLPSEYIPGSWSGWDQVRV